MDILVGCEYSGIVRDAFIRAGHNAVSCDILPSESPLGKHYQGDVVEVVKSKRWDMIIMHPPCTYIAVSGNAWYAKGKKGYAKRQEALVWTENLWNLCKQYADKVCFENPVGCLATKTGMGKAHYIQPWQFGHTLSKKTGLWLHNLKPLTETDNVYEEMEALPDKEKYAIWYASPGKDRGKIRSKFYDGIACAMANQWT